MTLKLASFLTLSLVSELIGILFWPLLIGANPNDLRDLTHLQNEISRAYLHISERFIAPAINTPHFFPIFIGAAFVIFLGFLILVVAIITNLYLNIIIL